MKRTLFLSILLFLSLLFVYCSSKNGLIYSGSVVNHITYQDHYFPVSFSVPENFTILPGVLNGKKNPYALASISTTFGLTLQKMILDNKIKNEFNATLRSICFSNIESNPDSTSQMLLELYLFKDSESNDTLVSRIAKLMDNMKSTVGEFLLLNIKQFNYNYFIS